MKQITIVVLLIAVVFHMGRLSSLITPVHPQLEKQKTLKHAAMKAGLGDPGDKIIKAVVSASQQTGLSQTLILSLMHSESSFNPKAVSSKNYQGLMQIPHKIHDEDINTLIGAKIFLAKLKITDGDYRKAVIIYKGWEINHPEGKRQADKVLALARRLNDV